MELVTMDLFLDTLKVANVIFKVPEVLKVQRCLYTSAECEGSTGGLLPCQICYVAQMTQVKSLYSNYVKRWRICKAMWCIQAFRRSTYLLL